SALDEHYDAVESRLDIDTEESERNAQNAVLAEGLDALGIPWRVIPRNVAGCGDCGHCGYGCRRGAKQSTMRTYLADALATGAELVARCHADRIAVKDGAAAGVEATCADGSRITVRAPLVVLAGGAIGTPALLLRSGLGGPQVGRSLHLHPVPAVLGLYERPIRTWSGVPQSVVSDAFARIEGGYGFRLEVPAALPGVLAAALPWRSAAQHRSLMEELAHVAVFIPIVRDREAGRVVIDRAGKAVLRYRVSGLTARLCTRAIVEAACLHLGARAPQRRAYAVSRMRKAALACLASLLLAACGGGGGGSGGAGAGGGGGDGSPASASTPTSAPAGGATTAPTSAAAGGPALRDIA